MNATPILDPRTKDLVSRVNEDVSLLRQDVGNLFSHTARQTIPNGAHMLAANAKANLAKGKTFTADQLNMLKSHLNQPATAWIGGAAALGLLAAGAYFMLHKPQPNGQSQELS